MSNKDYYGSQQPAGYPQQQQQYYPPSGPPPGQGGYFPQQPQQPQQAYQGYNGQPGYQQQAQPQAVYVQQPPAQKGSSGCCTACLAGVCLCCCAEEICECLF